MYEWVLWLPREDVKTHTMERKRKEQRVMRGWERKSGCFPDETNLERLHRGKEDMQGHFAKLQVVSNV